MVQILRAAMLFSIVLYGFIIKQFPVHQRGNPIVYYVIVLVAIWILFGVRHFRKKFVRRAEQILATAPDDLKTQERWQVGYVVIYALSEAIALYGLLLHFLGFPPTQVTPFLIGGIVLLLFYSPRLPPQSTA